MKKMRIRVDYECKADLIEYLSLLVERLKDEVYHPPLPLESDQPFRVEFGNRGKRVWLTCEKKGEKTQDRKE